MWSPQTTGAECPVAGKSTFQFTSASLIFVGIVLAWLMPVPFGPRKRVHSWAVLSGANEAKPARTSVVARKVFMRGTQPSRPLDGSDSRFLNGNHFEPAREMGQRLLHTEAFETRCANKTDGVGVLVDVSGVLRRGNRSAMGEEDDVFADVPCTFD